MALPSHPQTEAHSQEAALPAIFRDASANLESHPESLRIKKLIFCLCSNVWENDLETLNRVFLEELLRDLIWLNPSINSLKLSVYRLVNSLNNAESYTIPAEVIVEQLEVFYSDKIGQLAEQCSANCQGQVFTILLDRVVSTLEQQNEKTRIKKLLLAFCKNRWENDLKIIQKYSVRDLVLELYQFKPEIEDVKKSLTTIARGLNKPDTYLSIAQIVLDCVSILYEYKKYKNQCSTDGNILKSPTTTLLGETAPKSPGSSAEQSERTDYDIFDLRLNILQYVNPLRVKLLLFAVLDADWLEEQQDWSILENFTLDTLLRQILEAGQDFETLKSQLDKVSALLPNPEENQQTVENLLRIIQPLL
jgi:hypothetical protein